jgi:hypothetical protein
VDTLSRVMKRDEPVGIEAGRARGAVLTIGVVPHLVPLALNFFTVPIASCSGSPFGCWSRNT